MNGKLVAQSRQVQAELRQRAEELASKEICNAITAAVSLFVLCLVWHGMAVVVYILPMGYCLKLMCP